MIHNIRVKDEHLNNLLSDNKKSVIIINDKDFQREDAIRLVDYSGQFTKFHTFRVTHIHSGEGLKENYVVLSLAYVKTE